jgi:hypothetical protein
MHVKELLEITKNGFEADIIQLFELDSACLNRQSNGHNIFLSVELMMMMMTNRSRKGFSVWRNNIMLFFIVAPNLGFGIYQKNNVLSSSRGINFRSFFQYHS